MCIRGEGMDVCARGVRLRVHARACACEVAHMYACVVCVWVRMRVRMRARVHADVRACVRACVRVYDYYIILLYMRVQCVRTVCPYICTYVHSNIHASVCAGVSAYVCGGATAYASARCACVWTKATSVLDGHAKKSYHMDSVQKMEGFIAATEKPERTIPVLLDQEKGKQIANNRHILTCIIAAILYCGRQCIALRGDCESTIGHGNPGNFLAMLKIMAEHDPVLKQHLYTPGMKNATYVSPRSQSDIIDVIGRGVIQQALLQDINGATIFTIMSDEVTTFNKEELALVVRFVDNNDNIREEFLEFVGVKRITGVYIASAQPPSTHCTNWDSL